VRPKQQVKLPTAAGPTIRVKRTSRTPNDFPNLPLCDMQQHMTNRLTLNQRRARLFRNGRSQAVRIPREWEMQGDEVVVSREGRRLIIEPVARLPLEIVLAELPDLGEDLGPIEDHPPEPIDL
jgi:antitoxin VapB